MFNCIEENLRIKNEIIVFEILIGILIFESVSFYFYVEILLSRIFLR